LSGLDSMRSRGRAEIDTGEALQEVSLTCIFRPGVMPGQIAEIHDSMMGRSWRGKITGISHAFAGARVTTSLNLVRHVPGQ